MGQIFFLTPTSSFGTLKKTQNTSPISMTRPHPFLSATALLQCFDTVGWVAGRACKKLEWWDAGVVMCLRRGADLDMAQLMPLPLKLSLASVKSRLGLVKAHPGSPGQIQRAVKCVRVCACVCACVLSLRRSIDAFMPALHH